MVSTGCIRVEITVSNLIARALVMIFKSVFISDNGR